LVWEAGSPNERPAGASQGGAFHLGLPAQTLSNLQKAMQSIDANALSQPFIKAMDLIDRVKNQMMQKCISRPKLKGQKEMHRMPMRRLAQHQRRGAFDHLFYPLLIYFEMHSIISLPTSTLF